MLALFTPSLEPDPPEPRRCRLLRRVDACSGGSAAVEYGGWRLAVLLLVVVVAPPRGSLRCAECGV